MSVVQVLRKARSLVAKGWTRQQYFRLHAGRKCYCVSGAIAKACGVRFPDWGYQDATRVFQSAVCKGVFIPKWNDTQTDKRKVLKAFDKAIAFAQKGAV